MPESTPHKKIGWLNKSLKINRNDQFFLSIEAALMQLPTMFPE